MDFFRRSEKVPSLFSFDRILVPLLGDDAVDGPALAVAAMLLTAREGAVASLLHVIEVPFDRNLDAEDQEAVARADEILRKADDFLAGHKVQSRSSTVQARAAGPAIVDELNELGAQLIVMGLRYKKRFGGQWDAGRTVPYVMRNSTAPVWCLRAETEELAQAP